MTERPRFDPTINLGHLISLGGIVCVVVGSYWLMDWRLTRLENGLEKLSVAVIEWVRIDERLKDHGRRIDKLESK